MKLGKLDVDLSKALPLISAGLGVLGMVVSDALKKNETKALKSELKEELLKELTNK